MGKIYFMRSISALKIFQIIMGLSGIFILVLGVGYMEALKGGLTDLVLSNPLLGGLASGFPLIPLIHSSKQKFRLQFYDEITEADYQSGVYADTTSYEIPLDGWLWKIKTGVFQETQPSVDLKLSVSWSGDVEKQTWDSPGNNLVDYDILQKFGTTDSVAEYQHTYPIQLFFIENAVDSNDSGALYQENKLGGPGKYMEAGQLIFCNVHMDDYGGDDTTGVTNLVSEAIFIVACHKGRHRGDKDELAPWVTIVGELDSTSSGFSWLAMTNLRVVNLAVTLWVGLSTNTQGSLVIDKNAIDQDLTVDAIELHATQFLAMIFPLQDGTGAGTTYAPINTAYKRGPLYLKKGEVLQVRSQNVSSTFSIQFNYIPDYGYQATFNRRFEDTDYTDNEYDNNFIPLFVVPYDMYVTSVTGSISYITDNSTSDAIWELELIGLKSKNYLDKDDFLLTYANANVSGNILGATHGAGGELASLKTITIVNDNVDGTTNTTGAGKQNFAEAVADYYPSGAVIGMWFHSDVTNNIATLIINMQVEGLNRIKTTNAGTSILKSDMVAVHTQ